MQNWFECKVRYQKTMENGVEKMVTEAYLVEALSFTEAEARIIEEVTPFVSGEYTVSDIKRTKFAEIVDSPREKDDRFYKVKINFITLDEKSGSEKKTASLILVKADNIDTALKSLHAHMKGSMADYVVAKLEESAYIDVYAFADNGLQRKAG